MNQLSFLTNPGVCVIADASAIINLNGTGMASEVLKIIRHSLCVTDNAWEEIGLGANKGYSDLAQLEELERQGLAKRIRISGEGIGIYESLISGSTRESLDDGEAATIACACQMDAIVLLDESKAKRICNAKFPRLELVSTTALLLHPNIEQGLGSEQRVAAVINALKYARMSVPRELIDSVVQLIGPEVASGCPSLPKFARLT